MSNDSRYTQGERYKNKLKGRNCKLTGESIKSRGETLENEKRNKNIFFPDIAFSTDNGAMIAYMGYLKYHKDIISSLEINPNPSSTLV